jgi:hypothetical protein
MDKKAILHNWTSRRCALATMHGKEKVIAPLLKDRLGIEVVVPKKFNTDLFGTFTREVTRSGNQIEAARAKALAAMDITGLDLAIASEGSFGANPNIPFLASSLELVLLIDRKNKIEVAGHYRTNNLRVLGQAVTSPEEAEKLALAWGFPRQGVIVRAAKNSNKHIYKDITTLPELRLVTEKLLGKWLCSSVYLETDMRAHRSPVRMDSIKEATIDLILNCQSLCPMCDTPGFLISDLVRGLACRDCGLPTQQVLMTVSACQKCAYQEEKLSDAKSADPALCNLCNP